MQMRIRIFTGLLALLVAPSLAWAQVVLLGTGGTDAGAQATREVELAWDASPSAGVTYNIYRSEVAGGCAKMPPHSSCTKLNLTAVSVLTFMDAAVPVGKSYFYTVTAVRMTIESGPSNEAIFDFTVPAPPSNLRERWSKRPLGL